MFPVVCSCAGSLLTGVCPWCQVFTFSQLEDLVQASPVEIRQALDEMDAVEHEGRISPVCAPCQRFSLCCGTVGTWRLLEVKYRDRLFDRLLDTINVECDSFDDIAGDVTIAPLTTSFAEFAVRHALAALANERSDKPVRARHVNRTCSRGSRQRCWQGFWKLVPEKVALFRALLILRQVETVRLAAWYTL